MLLGKANKHTASDNTSGIITIIESAIKLPEDLRDEVCFVLFDNEELGLLGSSAFAKEYKEYLKNKLIINFDCVSDGNDIFFFPTKQIKNDQSKHEKYYKCICINRLYKSSHQQRIWILSIRQL
ncbi:MAG: M28 family peptidase [Holdemanella porci]